MPDLIQWTVIGGAIVALAIISFFLVRAQRTRRREAVANREVDLQTEEHLPILHECWTRYSRMSGWSWPDIAVASLFVLDTSADLPTPAGSIVRTHK